MQANLISVSNVDSSFGVEYALNDDTFSSNNVEERAQFIKTLTAKLYCIQTITFEKKEYSLVAIPKISCSKVINKGTKVDFERFMDHEFITNSLLNDLKRYFKSYEFELTDKARIDNQSTFEQITKQN